MTHKGMRDAVDPHPMGGNQGKEQGRNVQLRDIAESDTITAFRVLKFSRYGFFTQQSPRRWEPDLPLAEKLNNTTLERALEQ